MIPTLVILFLVLAAAAVPFGVKRTAGFSREVAGVLVVVLAALAVVAWRMP